MKSIIWILMFILAAQFVLGHGLAEEIKEIVSGNYTVIFETEPFYVVTLKKAHLDFIVNDIEGNPFQGLDVLAEVHAHDIGAESSLQAIEEESGHYSVSYVFTQRGMYDIHVEINGQEVGEFELEVDSFGKSGWIRMSIIVGIFLLLVWLAWNDCQKRRR